MSIKDMGTLFALAALWGASFLFIRIASPEMGPLITIEARVAIASFALILFISFTKRSLEWKKWWKQYIILGAINAAAPFTFIAVAELHLDASLSGILNSLTPLCTSLVAWGWLNEKLTMKKWIGMLLGIIGVVILVGWSPIHMTKVIWISIGFSVAAAISYGFGIVYSKKAFTGVAPLSLAAGQQIGASIALLPFMLWSLPGSQIHLSMNSVVSVVCLAFFCTAIAYLFFFHLMARVGPTKTATVTLLVPFFGILWGVLFLHEQVTIGMVIGFLVILSSVCLISGISFKTKRHNHRLELNNRM